MPRPRLLYSSTKFRTFRGLSSPSTPAMMTLRSRSRSESSAITGASSYNRSFVLAVQAHQVAKKTSKVGLPAAVAVSSPLAGNETSPPSTELAVNSGARLPGSRKSSSLGVNEPTPLPLEPDTAEKVAAADMAAIATAVRAAN